MQPTQTLPVIPLRNAVLFPGVSFPIAAGRPGTLHAIETAMKSPEQLVFALTQRQDVEGVTPELLHTVGTIAAIGPIQRGVGGARLLLQGKARGIAMRIQETDGRLEAVVVEAAEMPPLDAVNTAFVALLKELKERSAELAKKLGLPDEAPNVNPNGGAIAIGHPLGMSGARLVTTAMHHLIATRGRYALCTMCIGVGQGIAIILERA